MGIGRSIFVVSAFALGHAACSSEKCYIDCIGPPPGCHVEGAVESTECGKASCGTIVCPSDSGEDGSIEHD
jgi:hypothetical protein